MTKTKIKENVKPTQTCPNFTVYEFNHMSRDELLKLYKEFGTDIFDLKMEKKDKDGNVVDTLHMFRPELLSAYFSIVYYIKFVPPSYYRLPADLYRYNEKSGIYLPNTEAILGEEIKKMYLETYTSIPVEKVYSDIRASTHINRPEVDEHPFYIPMNERTVHILNVGGKYSVEMVDHNPTRFILIGVPNSYQFSNLNDMEKSRDIFTRYLNAVLPDLKDQTFLQEFLGVCLLRLQLYNKNLIILGPTKSGKTTLLNIIRNALGKKNCSSITFTEMSKNRFHTAELDGKLLNICDDLNNADVDNVSQFKVISGGSDQMGVERKFRDPYSIIPITKHIFSCNALPAVGGADSAFYGRFFIMKFKQKFTKEDEFIDKKLNTPEINSYILNWAVEGLLRVLNGGGFTYTQTPKEVYDIWNENNANPIVAYMNSENVIYEMYGLYLVTELENDIMEYAKNRVSDDLLDKKRPPSIQEIGRYVSSDYNISRERHQYHGMDKIFYRGIRPNRITDYQDFDSGDRVMLTPEEQDNRRNAKADDFVKQFTGTKPEEQKTYTQEELAEFARMIDEKLRQEEEEDAYKNYQRELLDITARQEEAEIEQEEQENISRSYEEWLASEEKEPAVPTPEEAEKERQDYEDYLNKEAYISECKEEPEPEEPDFIDHSTGLNPNDLDILVKESKDTELSTRNPFPEDDEKHKESE